ncbi:TM2 domain-containing protein [Oryzomonas rubra]|uniref:Zinc-ribbon domain and TM2 domain-containing protein n=1 Tax=Oryzomonas rubra TaxID=2509454 RepID=A0A5A9XMI1_9BACT|nr:TM2 domain-containing protein [Oryzomonas rubra]KAA0894286.1 zinc-ribbon domain and TM2 domain-containing protein [Oryzomonas rubra]
MAEIKFCTACGNELNIKAELCPKCGVRQAVKGGGSNRKITAGILALFLGGFGIHHFYLGNTGRGVLYLLFFWTFIPAIASFIEAIIFLTMSEDDFEAKYS